MGFIITIVAFGGAVAGTGHIRRAMTLSKAVLETLEARVRFITNEIGYNIIDQSDIIDNLRLSVHRSEFHPQAAYKCFEVLEREFGKSDAVILDNYHWDEKNEAPFHTTDVKVVVIDDLADRPHNCHILLDQNENHSSQDYAPLVPEQCVVLAGAQFALLRDEFRNHRDASLNFRDKTNNELLRCFLSLGGGDPFDMLPRLTSFLLDETPDIITLVAGSHINAKAELEAMAKPTTRLELEFDSCCVAKLMSKCDYAVSACGTMIWERAVLGLPSLGLVIVDNQIDTAQYLQKYKYHNIIDFRDKIDFGEFSIALSKIRAQKQRELYSKSSRILVDGLGANRVANALMNVICRAAK